MDYWNSKIMKEIVQNLLKEEIHSTIFGHPWPVTNETKYLFLIN